MADTDSVEFASVNSSPRMDRAYTVAFTAFSGYFRIRATNTAQNGYWAAIEAGGGSYWLVTPGGDNILYFDGSTVGSGEIRNPCGTSWIDVAWTRNGSNMDFYHKLGTDSSWSGPFSITSSSFTPTTFTFSGSTNFPTDGDATMRIGKTVIWSVSHTSAELLDETTSRDLVNTGNVFFYNRCTDASTVGTDAGGGGNNFTITGSPTTVADDPGFPASGGGGGPNVTSSRLAVGNVLATGSRLNARPRRGVAYVVL